MYQSMYREAWERRKALVSKLRGQSEQVDEKIQAVKAKWNQQWNSVQVEKKRIEWVIESLRAKVGD